MLQVTTPMRLLRVDPVDFPGSVQVCRGGYGIQGATREQVTNGRTPLFNSVQELHVQDARVLGWRRGVGRTWAINVP